MGLEKTRPMKKAMTIVCLVAVAAVGAHGAESAEEVFAALRAKADARIAAIRASPNRAVPEAAPKRFLSEKGGDDAADGMTPQTAWKTVARLNREKLAPGTYVLFARGGLYRGCVNAQPGVTYTAYGQGPKPAIYGSPEDGADPAKWERTDNPRVWAYAIGHNDVGTLVFDGGAAHAVKIVIRTDKKTGAKFNKFTGKPFNSYRDLDGDLHAVQLLPRPRRRPALLARLLQGRHRQVVSLQRAESWRTLQINRIQREDVRVPRGRRGGRDDRELHREVRGRPRRLRRYLPQPDRAGLRVRLDWRLHPGRGHLRTRLPHASRERGGGLRRLRRSWRTATSGRSTTPA